MQRAKNRSHCQKHPLRQLQTIAASRTVFRLEFSYPSLDAILRECVFCFHRIGDRPYQYEFRVHISTSFLMRISIFILCEKYFTVLPQKLWTNEGNYVKIQENERSAMRVLNLYAGGYASCCYYLTDDSGCFSVVIDPSAPPPLSAGALPGGASLSAVLLTHTHFDHMLALESWRALGAPVCVPESDAVGLTDPHYNVSATFFDAPTVFAPPDRLLHDGETIVFGDSLLTVVGTPGHTAGGVSYLGDGKLFCGDTLFANGGVGRQDVSGGSEDAICTSIVRLLSLPLETVIYPGHGGMTTVAAERMIHGLS